MLIIPIYVQSCMYNCIYYTRYMLQNKVTVMNIFFFTFFFLHKLIINLITVYLYMSSDWLNLKSVSFSKLLNYEELRYILRH